MSLGAQVALLAGMHNFSVRLAFVSSLLAACTAACGPDKAGPAPSTDGGTQDANPADGGGEVAPNDPQADAGRPTCNPLTLAGVSAGNARGTAETKPAPSGGTLADGTYVFVEAIYYGVPSFGSLPLMRSRLAISGTQLQTVEGATDPNDASEDRTFTDTLSVGATTITSTPTCPTAGQPKVIGFTVGPIAGTDGGSTGTQLTLFVTDGGAEAAMVFRKE